MDLKELNLFSLFKGTITHDFSMKDIVEQSQTTTWEHSFGVGLETSFSAGVPLIGETSFSISLSYNYKNGGSNTVTSKQEVLENFKVM